MWKSAVGLLLFHTTTFALAHSRLNDPNYIPDYLVECYRYDWLQLMPMSMRTLIDLIRKTEATPDYPMDLRIQVNTILSRFWRDGIVRDPNVAQVPNTVPYTGGGSQYYKYSILRKMVPIPEIPQFADNLLTLNERCTLHHMISSSVQLWERGDEYQVCPQADPQHQILSDQLTGAKKSSCPVEKGVVHSEFGTVSPNHVLLAIASSLQRMEINQQDLQDGLKIRRIGSYVPNKTIDNFLACTVLGDLAELLVFQLPFSNNPRFGPGGWWNDDTIPARFYMKTNYHGVRGDLWQATDAEILGGIDGLMLGSQITSWLLRNPTLRLSQVLETFYTNRMEPNYGQLGACERLNFVRGTLIKSRSFYSQSVNLAEVLAANSPNSIMNNTFISENREKTSNAFEDHVMALVNRPYFGCERRKHQSQAGMNLNVIYDATWDPYTTLRILTRIAINVNVGKYSAITVINGATGETLVHSASTTGDLYQTWMSLKNAAKEVKSPDLTNGFLDLKNITESESFRKTKSHPAAHITLVLGRTSILTDAAFEHIRSTVEAIKSEIPDMRFVYVIKTGDSRPWVKLTSSHYAQNDEIITMDDDNLENLYSQLETVSNAPLSIIPPSCSYSQITGKDFFTVEQKITPKDVKTYMIHPAYFCSSSFIDIQVEIQNNLNTMRICISRHESQSKSPYCGAIGKLERFRYRIENPCWYHVAEGQHEDWNPNCRPIYVTASNVISAAACTDFDCRVIDEVKFSISVEGISCLRGFGVPCSAISPIPATTFILLTITSWVLISMSAK